MGKKLIAMLVAAALIACSSVPIYAASTKTSSQSASKASTKTAAKASTKKATKESTKKSNTKSSTKKKTTPKSNKKKAKTKKSAAEKKKEKEKAKKKAKEKLKKGYAAYIRSINPGVSKSKAKRMAGYFMSKAKKYDLDAKVLIAMAQHESTFRTKVKSSYGCKGLMQTSDALARQYGYKPSSVYKAGVSIEVGAHYLSSQKKHFGTYTKAISAYNWGPGNVQKGRYNTRYAKRVLKTRDKIRSYLKKHKYV